MDNQMIVAKCKLLLEAYKSGKLGQTKMPEDTNPGFLGEDKEARLTYFTLPMALNYQRDSYKMWEAALKTYNDPETNWVFDIERVDKSQNDKLMQSLTKHKLALQPNKHTNTWRKISNTIFSNFVSIEGLFEKSNNDYLELRRNVQIEHKAGFPYLSGPKIFNYWCFIMRTYGKIDLKNSDYIDIAPDTHIVKCSVKLGVITEIEAEILSREQISERWRNILKGSGINPIDMHPPLWFWSRNGFLFDV